MDLNSLWDDSEYEKEIPCPNCGKRSNPTVVGGNWKCSIGCGHLFREDGTKPTMDCFCKKCAPMHDPLAGKTKGKKAELDLTDDTKESKSTRRSTKRRPAKRSRN